MRRLPTQIVVKERSRRLTKFFESFQPHSHLLDQVIPVWFDIVVSEFTRVGQQEDGEEESGPKIGAKVAKKKSVGHSKAYTKVRDREGRVDNMSPYLLLFVCYNYYTSYIIYYYYYYNYYYPLRIVPGHKNLTRGHIFVPLFHHHNHQGTYL